MSLGGDARAEALRRESETVRAIGAILRPLGLGDISTEREGGYARVLAHSTASFVEVTWDARDKFRYRVGPYDGEIPAVQIASDPGIWQNRYELDVFLSTAMHRLTPEQSLY